MRYYTGHSCVACGSLKTREISHARLRCDNCRTVQTMRDLLRHSDRRQGDRKDVEYIEACFEAA